jgi:SPP1 family predicted phage head-tail adaptor
MEIGKLNKRVTLQYSTRTPDGMGGFSLVWNSITPDIWAALWPVSASETVQSNQQVMTISHRIRIRYRSVLKPNYRIKYGNRYFAIVSIINPEERNEWLDILVKEAV